MPRKTRQKNKPSFSTIISIKLILILSYSTLPSINATPYNIFRWCTKRAVFCPFIRHLPQPNPIDFPRSPFLSKRGGEQKKASKPVSGDNDFGNHSEIHQIQNNNSNEREREAEEPMSVLEAYVEQVSACDEQTAREEEEREKLNDRTLNSRKEEEGHTKEKMEKIKTSVVTETDDSMESENAIVDTLSLYGN